MPWSILILRHVKSNQIATALILVRIGTSGLLQPNIPMDSFLLSHYATGLDDILHFYEKEHVEIDEMTQSLITYLGWSDTGIVPYTAICSQELEKRFGSNRIRLGMTLTNIGFYGPQERELRLKQKLTDFHSKLASFRYQDNSITNLEMETATIYGLSRVQCP